MRAVVVLALLIAGCAAPSIYMPDATAPLYSGSDRGLHQFGPPANGTADGYVVLGRCTQTENVSAYTIDARRLLGSDRVRLEAMKGVPNATAFAIVGYVPGPDGLVVSWSMRGGTNATIDPYHVFYAQWSPGLPESLTVNADPDGIVRIVIACRGDGAVNYVLSSDGESPRAPKAPDYLDGIVATGFDAFLAIASGPNAAIYIPPTGPPPLAGVIWSTSGNVQPGYDQTVPAGPRMGQASIAWNGRAGWTDVACTHYGWAEHGSWSYQSELSRQPVDASGMVHDDIATLWLTQTILFGDMLFRQTGERDEPASLRFTVEHLASSPMFWNTFCQGIHLDATLETLFGQRSAEILILPRGFV